MGKNLDRYELIDVIGTGAFATVWRAHDPVIERDVAIKVLAENWARDAEMRDRFITEARIALEATSPSLIRVHTVAEDSETGQPYIVMNIANGGTLETRLREQKLTPPTARQALALTRDIAVAIAALHHNGILHRDLKPGNVLFHTTNGVERPVLGDFGLARALDRSALTMVSGTPAYTAPEQAAGLVQLTEQADLYPLGIMFLEMITGFVPSHANMASAATTRVDLASFLSENKTELPTEYVPLISSLIDPNPENRPKSASDVVAHIDGLLGAGEHPGPARALGQAIAAPPAPQTPAPVSPLAPTTMGEPARPLPTDAPGPSPSRLKPAIVGSAILCLVLLVLAGFVLTRNSDTSTANATTTTEAGVASTTTTQPIEEPTTSTVAAEVTTIASTTAPGSTQEADVIPGDFPLPPGALIDRAQSTDDRFQVYRYAGNLDAVSGFYESVEGWTVTNETIEDPTMSITLTNNIETIVVKAEAVDNTTGIALTTLTVTPSD